MADDTQPLPATEAGTDAIAPEPATVGGGKSEIAGALKGALNGDTKPVPDKNPQAALRRKVDAALQAAKEPAADGRVRGADGKFATKDATDAPAKAPDAGKTEAVATPAPAAAIEAPTAWKKEIAAEHWAKLPPAVQSEIMRREGDVAKLWEAHQQLKPLAPVMGFANEIAPRLGVNGQTLVQQWAQFQAAIMDSAKKEEAFQWLEKQYSRVKAPASAAAPAAETPAAEWVDPQVAALQKQLKELSDWKTGQESEAQKYQREALESYRTEKQSAFEKFAAEKGADGQPLRPHLDDAVMKKMATLIAEAKTANPQLSDQDALQQAYEEAVWGNPTIRANLIEQQRLADERKRNDAARERAQAAHRPAVSPATSSPQGPTGARAAPPKDPRAHILQSLAAVTS